jgi:hypothetical protein
VAQLAMQEQTAKRLEAHYHPDVIFGDGNLLLTSGGWAINYTGSGSAPACLTAPEESITYIEALYDYITTDKPLLSGMGLPMPGLNLMRWLHRLDRQLKLGLTNLPDALIFLDIEPEAALARITARGKKPDHHENLSDMSRARLMLRTVVEFFCRRRGPNRTATIHVTGLSLEQILAQAIDFVHHLPLPQQSAATPVLATLSPTLPPARKRVGAEQRRDAAVPMVGRPASDTLVGAYPAVEAYPAVGTQATQAGRTLQGVLPKERLGTTQIKLADSSVAVRKALTYQYLIRYTLPNLHRGSARELTFPLSSLGRLSLREGYSADLMKAIYLQESQDYGLLDRIFLNHPLHKAVYHRLQVLKCVIAQEFGCRLGQLPPEKRIKVMTAPSGYAFDLLQPLKQIVGSNRVKARSIHLLASDLDPDGRLERGLTRTARLMDLGFRFTRGDLTSAEIKDQLRQAGPYDMIVFIGLSAWISKTSLLSHLKLIRQQLLVPGGVLFMDCFSPQVSALSGKYLGYKANYYQPEEFSSLLAYCGFDPAQLTWESGPDEVDHVFVARI